MTEPGSVHEDLRYVRGVVHRAELPGSPAAIYFLWAVLTFFGYAMIDFAPEKTGFYWMIVGPLGGVLSGWLGWRSSRVTGQQSREEGMRHTLHWMGFMCAVLLTVPLRAAGLITTEALPRIIVLLVAFSYYAIGIFEDRRMIWIGTLVACAYVLSIVLRDFRHVWTVTAAVMSTALLVAGITARRAPRRSREGVS